MFGHISNPPDADHVKQKPGGENTKENNIRGFSQYSGKNKRLGFLFCLREGGPGCKEEVFVS